MVNLGGFRQRLDAFLELDGDSMDQQETYTAVVIPALKAAADELESRWLSARESVGGIDGMLLAAETLRDLSQRLREQVGLQELEARNGALPRVPPLS